MPQVWTSSPTTQIVSALTTTLLRDYNLRPRVPWDREPQPKEFAVFVGEELEIPLLDEEGGEVARMWVSFVENPDTDDDPYLVEVRGWHLDPGYC